MGFRFRKSLRILPGVKINLSKTGGSLSLGGRGASVNLGRKGVKTTVGLPGSGMSYSEQTSYPDAMPREGRSNASGLGKIALMILAGLGFAAYHYFMK